MLLADFKAVLKIDDQIDDLQNRLNALYSTRARYIDSARLPAQQQVSTPISTLSLGLEAFAAPTSTNKTKWLDGQYGALKAIWTSYGLTIPSKKTLTPRLSNAKQILDKLATNHPELAGKFDIVLVPPTALLNEQSIATLRLQQPLLCTTDHFDSSITFGKTTRNWRVLVAHSGVDGLSLGSAENILATKSYKIAGFDMRALGVYEYMALSLQSDFAIDTKAWSLLLKGTKQTDSLVVSAACVDGTYRYEQDDIHGFGAESFRPAVEVKV